MGRQELTGIHYYRGDHAVSASMTFAAGATVPLAKLGARETRRRRSATRRLVAADATPGHVLADTADPSRILHDGHLPDLRGIAERAGSISGEVGRALASFDPREAEIADRVAARESCE